MPAVAARAAAATATATAAAAAAATQASRHSALLAPAVIAAVYRHRDVFVDRFTKIIGTGKPLPSSPFVVCQSNLHALPELIMCLSPKGPNQQMQPCSSKGKQLSHLSAASTAFFGDQHSQTPYGIPRLPVRRRSSGLPRAYKSNIFRLPFPVSSEKPEWWMRTLSCVPYLLALQISDTGYFIQPFLDRYECFADLIYYVPGAVSRLPMFFPMIYCYIGYICIVKNKDLPHFFRFHLMMGMLLETALQLVWYSSNFFPLIHYNGTFGMYYWAGIGLAYILLLLYCVRCALVGGYPSVPGVSDAALVHTLFNIGSFQRPF